MGNCSILDMLLRRMSEAMTKRGPFPTDEAALRQRLATTREKLMECLGAMPDEIVSPDLRVEAKTPLGRTNVIQERVVYRTLGAEENFKHDARITNHDITEEFGNQVIAWLDKHLTGAW